MGAAAVRLDLDDLARAQAVLEHTFGYKSFRSHQKAIVETLLAGRDALVLMPTGGGKSLCYQVPALVRDGVGVVVSPLIALMQDQVDTLREAGVAAAYLNSTVSWADVQRIERDLERGDLQLLYVAPERLVQDRTLALLSRTRVALFAIDEAHCVSQWGHDFRPEYRMLRVLPERFPNVPRIALTATADARTRQEIVAELALDGAETFVASFDRPNIRYTIAQGGNGSPRDQLWRFLSAEHPRDAGIVYGLSRKICEETAAWLRAKGRIALHYHAGMAAEERAATQARFLKEDGIIVCATIAFGMGIDKPDVRFVAHLGLPKNIEGYYQATGRAGRDGEPASAWMTYGMQDIITQRQFVDQSDALEDVRRVMRGKLDALVGLAETAMCRRQRLLAYFGETLAEPCGNCDNCLTPPETIDATEAARKALSAVYRTRQRFGMTYVIDVLLGKDDERIVRMGDDKLSVFGIGKELRNEDWKNLVRQLVANGLLAPDGDGHGTLQFTDQTAAFLKDKQPFLLRRGTIATAGAGGGAKSERRRSGRNEARLSLAVSDQGLFDALKALRSELAVASGVPPYVIFHDKTLIEIATKKPRTTAELHTISGLGDRKVARYGAALVAVVAERA
jgi:ATP-dependent DNA helicase RecQ